MAVEVLDLPPLAAGDREWVKDFASVLSTSTEGFVARKFDAIANATGDHLRLVTVRRIDYGQTIEDFAAELFSHWFPTPEEKENEALVVMATEDHRTAIVAGPKVTATASPETIESIASTTLLLPAQKSNYNQSAMDGASRLFAVLTGEPDPGPPQVQEEAIARGTFASAEETDVQSSTWIVAIVLVIATAAPMVTYYFLQSRN